MSNKIDIARALKDQAYFDSLTEEEKDMVRASSPVGSSELSEGDLDSVSGGLEGGGTIAATTTTTNLKECTCSAIIAARAAGDCTCAC